ncbi:MAG: capsule biosynthesis protein, partial [Boseongicola sp.]
AIDSNTGVLEIEVRAFTPEDAQTIGQSIIRRSADLVEDLSRVARNDAMRFTLQDVVKAEERLKEMRRRIRDFRTQYQIIDPEADVEIQTGIVSALQSSLAEALIELETIKSYSEGEDLRLPNIQRRIEAIRNQIANERNAVSNQTEDGRALSDIIGQYEELLVDLEFSQNAYTAALASEEQARIEANRRSRYLAVHIPPTLAEESLYPQRWLLLLVMLACTFAFWAILVLIYYNVRDRR